MPDDNYQLVRRVMLATNKLDGVYYLFARRHRLNENALAFLYALSDGQPHSQKEVSDEWLIPRTTVHSIVKMLLAEGYIVFAPAQHAKEKSLLLTAKGQAYADALLADIYIAEEKAIAGTLEHFPPDFVAALEDLSDRLFDELQKASTPTDH